jgi:hypothetical protein
LMPIQIMNSATSDFARHGSIQWSLNGLGGKL